MLQQERRINNQFLSVRAFNDCNLGVIDSMGGERGLVVRALHL